MHVQTDDATSSLRLPGGRRLTPQRRLVYQTLAATDVHPDAEQVIAMVRAQDAEVSIATVYNTLRLLADAGMVRELRGLGPKTRYDANIDEHDHFTCRVCGVVEDIPRQVPVPSRLRGRGLGRHRVDDLAAHFRGVCGTCRAAGPRRPSIAVRTHSHVTTSRRH